MENLSLQNRLTTYSTLAVAGACALAVVPQAEAAIVYSGQLNQAIPPTSTGAFINLSSFTYSTTAAGAQGGDTAAPLLNLWGTTAARAWLYPTSSTVNRFVSTATGNFPLELALNAPIDAAATYGTSATPSALTVATGTQWAPSSTGYLGFKFLNGATTEYGWALISVPAAGPTAADPIRLLGVAYENTGAGITAGAGAVPEPTSVAALAVGAVGAAAAWRRRKAA